LSTGQGGSVAVQSSGSSGIANIQANNRLPQPVQSAQEQANIFDEISFPNQRSLLGSQVSRLAGVVGVVVVVVVVVVVAVVVVVVVVVVRMRCVCFCVYFMKCYFFFFVLFA
jgi:hypothetical protein